MHQAVVFRRIQTHTQSTTVFRSLDTLRPRKKLGYGVEISICSLPGAVKMISLSLVAAVVASPDSGTLRLSCTQSIGCIHQKTQSPPRSWGRLCFDVVSFGCLTFNVKVWLSNTTNRRHCKLFVLHSNN